MALEFKGLQDLAEVFGHYRCCLFPQMKTKQIPDDFRDWIETKTFEIVASTAFPPQSTLKHLKQVIIRRCAGGAPICDNRP